MRGSFEGLALEDFTLEQKVGDGGLAEVYRATQRRPNRTVAIKVLRRHQFACLDEMREVLRREGEITAALASEPAVVTVYRYDTTTLDDGSELAWIALEWIDGLTLKQERERNPERWTLQYDALLADLAPVFCVLGAGHARGIVHCDISPSNLMFDGRGRARLLDLGAARTFTPEQLALPLDRTEHTTSALFANKRWCAPEQREEERRRVAPSSDVYSLAKVIVYALTGECLAWRETPEAAEMDLGPWTGVLTRAMAWRQSDRYPDAMVFFRALEAALRDAPERSASLAVAPGIEISGDDARQRSDTRRAASWPRWTGGSVATVALLFAVAFVVRSKATEPRASAESVRQTGIPPSSAPTHALSIVEVPTAHASQSLTAALSTEHAQRAETRARPTTPLLLSRLTVRAQRRVANRAPLSEREAPISAPSTVAPVRTEGVPVAARADAVAPVTSGETPPAQAIPPRAEARPAPGSSGDDLRRDALAEYLRTHPDARPRAATQVDR